MDTDILKAIVVAWVSRNANNVGNRSVSSALYNVGHRALQTCRSFTNGFQQMSVQAGDIAAYFIYRDDDKPKYRRGNTALIAINILAIFVFIGAKLYYVFENRRRDKAWNAKSEREKADYIKNTKLVGISSDVLDVS